MTWRWRPRTLAGQLAVLLIGGLLAAQWLTGSIWFDLRRHQDLEMPTRLLGAHLADSWRWIEATPAADRAALLARISVPNYQLTLRHAPSSEHVDPPADVVALLNAVTSEQLGHPASVQLREASLIDEHRHSAGIYDLFFLRTPVGSYHLQLPLSDGQWLDVRAIVGQAGLMPHPWRAIADYLVRIYLLRMLLVVVVVLLAVRLILKPLRQLAEAAQALGRDIHSPPLAEQGPSELRVAAAAFNRMQQELIEAIKQRGRFLRAVSHDLRSPITRLRLRTEMLDDESVKERFRHDLAELEKRVTATLALTRELPNDEVRQWIDIDALLADVLAPLHETGREVSVHGSAEPLLGYAQALRRCIANLIDNALRYGDGAEICIEDSAHDLQLSICDRGPGVPDDELKRVLEPYYRGNPARGASEGSGLGLAIADAVAQGHGGSLQLRNREGGGLEVRLRLPRSQPLPSRDEHATPDHVRAA